MPASDSRRSRDKLTVDEICVDLDISRRTFYEWRAQYLGYSGSYPAARDLFQLIADALTGSDAYGPEHRDTLAARINIARWAGLAGDAAGARDQFAALLPVRERVLGAEHPGTLVTRHELASWTGGRGMRPGPVTSSPRCCPSASGSRAPSTPAP